MSDIHCPKCESDDVTCTDRPHTHVCNSCGYDGRRPNIEIYPHQVAEGADPEWGWRLKAGNGEIVAQGEGYTKADAAEAMARKIGVDNAYADARVLVLNWSGHEIEERTPTVLA